jgi:hypothetical protein
MRLPNPNNLDYVLQSHLERTLDGQRGKARASFQKLLQAEEKKRAATTRKIWLWAGIPSALAASFALAIGLLALRNTTDSFSRDLHVTPGPTAAMMPVMNQVEVTRNLDAGTGLLPDQTPVHLVREQTLRQTQWVDPQDRATYSVTQPIEKVGYVKIQPY